MKREITILHQPTKMKMKEDKETRKSSSNLLKPGKAKTTDMYLEVVKQEIVGVLKRAKNILNLSRDEEQAQRWLCW